MDCFFVFVHKFFDFLYSLIIRQLIERMQMRLFRVCSFLFEAAPACSRTDMFAVAVDFLFSAAGVTHDLFTDNCHTNLLACLVARKKVSQIRKTSNLYRIGERGASYLRKVCV